MPTNNNYEEKREGMVVPIGKPWDGPAPFTLEEFRKQHYAWALKTFGPDQDPLLKLEGEVQELQAQPKDLEEYADCLILLLDGFSKHLPALTAADLLLAAFRKLEKNKARKWQPIPGKPGTFQHVKEEDL